jgi:hypothetical protein
MAAPFSHPSLAIIRQEPGFRYQTPAYENDAFGLWRSQKSEPGFPGSLSPIRLERTDGLS